MPTGWALTYIQFTLISILFIEKEQWHSPCVCFFQSISHQKLCLSDKLLLLLIFLVNLNDFKYEGFHRDCHSWFSLVAHELKSREVERLCSRIIQRLLLISEKRRLFSHYQLAYLQNQVLLFEFFRLIELSCRLKTNLLQMLAFCLRGFHSYFKYLTLVRIQWLVGQSTAQKEDKYLVKQRHRSQWKWGDLLIFSDDLLGSDRTHSMICLGHDAMQIEFSCDFKQVSCRNADWSSYACTRFSHRRRLYKQIALSWCAIVCLLRRWHVLWRLTNLVSVSIIAHCNFLHCLSHHGHLDLKLQ